MVAEAEFDDQTAVVGAGEGEPRGVNLPRAAPRDYSVLRQVSVLAAVVVLAAAAFDYEHGRAAIHWFQHWVR